MGREELPVAVRYHWTEVDRNTAQLASQGKVTGAASYVTPYRILAASIPDAAKLPLGATSPWLNIGRTTNERAYVDKFRPEGFVWQLKPTDLPAHGTIRELCSALLAWCKTNKTDIFPPELYDLSRPNRPGPKSGDIPIEKLLFDFWYNTVYRFACSEINKGKAEKDKTFSYANLLAAPITVGSAELAWVLAKEPVTASRAVAAGGSGPQVLGSPKRPDGKDYAYFLNEAKEALKNVGFGRAEIPKSPGAPAKFDDTFWTIEPSTLDPDVNKHRLALKSAYAGEASKAIDAIIVHPEKWSFDCGQFVQVLQMYARMHMMGPRAWSTEVGNLRFEYRDSRGVGASVTYSPNINAATGTPHLGEYVGSSGGPAKTLDAVLADAPVGSLVVWTKPNEIASVDNPYQNERGVKVGSDSYWCHGFTKNPYTRSAFELEYSQHGTPGPVYIAEVTYVTHPAPR